MKDYSRWTANSVATLGFRGEMHDPVDCPRGKKLCDDCPAFMGHNLEGPAFVGEAARFCCADKLPDAEPTP